ncbi:MAG: glycosyltransferase family 2 protein [Chlorobium sp.]|nr:glycosyltransferase family 2 protein [Chlorobium sp.]
MDNLTVIIPAHNEEQVIGRTLSHLLHTESGNNEIIVVCNGCTDKTEEIVQSFFPKVVLIKTDCASKTHALNLGDQVAKFWPRIYADADVCIKMESVKKLAVSLNKPGVMAVSPRAINSYDKVSWLVKAFYSVWTELPYYQSGMIGCGVYGLSQEGRMRFESWPDIIADDGYIRAMFTGSERAHCPEAIVMVNVPRTIMQLIRVKTRSRLGRYQLAKMFPSLSVAEGREKDYSSAFWLLLKRPSLYVKALVYLLVNLISRIRAKKQLKKFQNYTWERDSSSRAAQ